MIFEMSTNIAVQTTEPEKAVKFYTVILGFGERTDDPEFAGTSKI